MDVVKLYHISYDCDEPLCKEFIPRIPDNILNGESETIPRICFSDSIEGCINARQDGIVTIADEEYISIIVWEVEIAISDPNLKSWVELYESDLVPDAALTHEYWYLESLQLTGTFYEIHKPDSDAPYEQENILIAHKYREPVLKVLSEHDVDLRKVQNLDLCTIVNHWIPRHYPYQQAFILEEIKNAVTVVKKFDSDENIFMKIFETSAPQYSYADLLPQRIYYNLKICKHIEYS